MRLSLRYRLVAIVPLIALGSCTQRHLGSGVILWESPEYPFRSGEVVEVLEESYIEDTYLVRYAEGEEGIVLPTWRVRFFPKSERATSFAEQYAAYRDNYAFSQRDGLPIRQEANQEAKILYKIRKGELLKVLGRGEQLESAGAYEDYWYEVLTEDGTLGFSFGYLLTNFATEDDPKKEIARLLQYDPFLDMFMTSVWRPEYFWEMILSRKIDLSRFRNDVGLFPDRESKTISLVTHTFSTSFKYEKIERVGSDRYVFADSGFRVLAQSDERISVSYQIGGQNVSTTFVIVKEDIPEIIGQERERRKRVYRSLLQKGNMLRSEAYGDIVLQDDMSFVWRGFDKMPPRVFVREVEGPGEVDFPYFLSGELEKTYDGVISFRFREYTEEETTSFLYKLVADGVQFVFARQESFEKNEIASVGSSPLVVFFRFLSLVESVVNDDGESGR